MSFSRTKNKKIVTLQVRILNEFKIHTGKACHGKKTFLSVPASLTLEAVMCLTLFIFASVCLILPMKVMNTERRMQAALEMMGEDFSQYAYVKDAQDKGKIFAIPGAGDFAKEFCRHLISGAAQGYAQARIGEYVDTNAVRHITMARSQVLEDGESIDLVLDYEIHLPFPVLGIPALERTARCRRRAWVGREGKDYSKGEGGQKEEDPVVYVGKNSTRYHRSRECHYLANQLTSVSKEQVGNMRNDSGGKYYPCSVCGKNAGRVVFIMPSGSSYHSGKSCRAIVAFARAVKLSEVEHLGACSYCGR
ncbi:MAG: hypothetical protein HFG54_05850 [Lachnospiraceae bacterium]|jgi:hypothetical protein|nr:hypothetical protein [Lachnospiraceae bacterium]